MRSSLDGDEDQGAEPPTVVRGRMRHAHCVPDRPVNGGNSLVAHIATSRGRLPGLPVA